MLKTRVQLILTSTTTAKNFGLTAQQLPSWAFRVMRTFSKHFSFLAGEPYTWRNFDARMPRKLILFSGFWHLLVSSIFLASEINNIYHCKQTHSEEQREKVGKVLKHCPFLCVVGKLKLPHPFSYNCGQINCF